MHSINYLGGISEITRETWESMKKEKTKDYNLLSTKGETYFEAVQEMFPKLSKGEIRRRINSGALNVGEPLTVEEANQPIGFKKPDQKGYDFFVIKFGKDRRIIVLNTELREEANA